MTARPGTPLRGSGRRGVGSRCRAPSRPTRHSKERRTASWVRVSPWVRRRGGGRTRPPMSVDRPPAATRSARRSRPSSDPRPPFVVIHVARPSVPTCAGVPIVASVGGAMGSSGAPMAVGSKSAGRGRRQRTADLCRDARREEGDDPPRPEPSPLRSAAMIGRSAVRISGGTRPGSAHAGVVLATTEAGRSGRTSMLGRGIGTRRSARPSPASTRRDRRPAAPAIPRAVPAGGVRSSSVQE